MFLHIMVSWYETARATSDAIAFTIPGKLSKISSSFIYDKI